MLEKYSETIWEVNLHLKKNCFFISGQKSHKSNNVPKQTSPPTQPQTTSSTDSRNDNRLENRNKSRSQNRSQNRNENCIDICNDGSMETSNDASKTSKSRERNSSTPCASTDEVNTKSVVEVLYRNGVRY